MQREYLVFDTGGRSFGLAIADVERVVSAVRPLPLPHSPACIEGLVNVGGKAVAMLDLRVWFGAPPRPVALSDYLVIVRAGSRCVALHVEAVRGVFTIADADIQPADTVVPDVKHFSGVVMLDAVIVLLPDIADFLAAADLVQLPELEGA